MLCQLRRMLITCSSFIWFWCIQFSILCSSAAPVCSSCFYLSVIQLLVCSSSAPSPQAYLSAQDSPPLLCYFPVFNFSVLSILRLSLISATYFPAIFVSKCYSNLNRALHVIWNMIFPFWQIQGPVLFRLLLTIICDAYIPISGRAGGCLRNNRTP